jgi:uncharacterized membrane protein SpoIIM required for sporulation
MSKRFSKAGAALSLAYVLITVSCIIASLVIQNDAKGRFMLLQLPIAFQIGPFQALGLGEFLASLGWVASYLIFGIPAIFALYFVGGTIGRFFSLYCYLTTGSNRSLRSLGRAKARPLTKR